MDSPESLQQHLAAIVEGSDDAIVTKNLESIILSWNRGAERLFGYTAEEAVGQPITIIFPDDRLDEEVGFIARLRRGERIHHFETVRKRKDGLLVPVSLTVSPVRDENGRVVGASKIARDITLQQQIAEQQKLLLAEMRHRVGNSFAVASGLLSITAQQTDSVKELVQMMRHKLNGLATVHSMAVGHPTGGATAGTPLDKLVTAILEPFTDLSWVEIDLPDVPVRSAAITPFSLIFFELATNAVKYGGLSSGGQGISVKAEQVGERLLVQWEERLVTAPASGNGEREGFGTQMIQHTVSAALGGKFSRTFSAGGMAVTLDLDLATVTEAWDKAQAPQSADGCRCTSEASQA